jgi:xylan 1,4-beta-xylosidase
VEGRLADHPDQPSVWARRQQHMNATVSTTVRFTPKADGDKAGLVALQNDDFYWFVGLVRDGGRTLVRVEKRAGKGDPVDGVVVAEKPVSLGKGQGLDLRISVKAGSLDFAYGTAGTWQTLEAGADGTTLSTKVAGGFVGTMLGVYAHGAED